MFVVVVQPIHVLLQGVHLFDENCQEVTDILREKFMCYENSIAKGKHFCYLYGRQYYTPRTYF